MRRDVQKSFQTKFYTSRYTKNCTNTSIEEAVNTYIRYIIFFGKYMYIYAIYKCTPRNRHTDSEKAFCGQAKRSGDSEGLSARGVEATRL